MTNSDFVPLWAAVPKRTIQTVLPTPPPPVEPLPPTAESAPPDPDAIAESDLAISPDPPKPTDTPTPRGRLTLRDEGALEQMEKWFQFVKSGWKEVIEFCGFPPGSDLEKTAQLMMFGFISQDLRHVIRVTGWDRKWVTQRCRRARAAGIWKGNGLFTARWFDYAERQDGSAEVAFMCDVMVINGDMEVTADEKYYLSETGLQWAKKLK